MVRVFVRHTGRAGVEGEPEIWFVTEAREGAST